MTAMKEHVHSPACQHDHGPRPDPVRRAEPKIGRNDPCPCRSGKKFKKCCGAGAARASSG
ncbi:MAG: SEC-C metal-binding domain-containing protein [Candidatus Binatia bacterium]